MTSRDFAFWLMGSLELSPPEKGLDKEQTKMLQNHLNMVFAHDVTEDGELKESTQPTKTTTITGDADFVVNC